MKKVMMIAAFAAALVSCQSKGTQNNDAVAVDEGVMAGHPVCIERGQRRS